MDKTQTPKKKRVLCIVLGIVLGSITLTALLFYFLAYPILQFSVLGLTQHQGKELFLEQTYLEFDHGNEFRDAVEGLDFVSVDCVEDFVYYDHCRQDHLLWGKFPDIYMLDVCVGEKYDQIYAQYRDENAPTGHLREIDIILYDTEKVASKFNQLYLAFSKEQQLVRILYRTGLSEKDLDEKMVCQLVSNKCMDLYESSGYEDRSFLYPPV